MTTKSKKQNKEPMKFNEQQYIDTQIAHYFHLLDMKIAKTKNDILNWFIKIFIGQVTGFITIFIALANIIRG